MRRVRVGKTLTLISAAARRASIRSACRQRRRLLLARSHSRLQREAAVQSACKSRSAAAKLLAATRRRSSCATPCLYTQNLRPPSPTSPIAGVRRARSARRARNVFVQLALVVARASACFAGEDEPDGDQICERASDGTNSIAHRLPSRASSSNSRARVFERTSDGYDWRRRKALVRRLNSLHGSSSRASSSPFSPLGRRCRCGRLSFSSASTNRTSNLRGDSAAWRGHRARDSRHANARGRMQTRSCSMALARVLCALFGVTMALDDSERAPSIPAIRVVSPASVDSPPLACHEPSDLIARLAAWHRDSTTADAEPSLADRAADDDDWWSPAARARGGGGDDAALCAEPPATDLASTVMQRSLCPWSWRSSYDEHREPKTLTEAFCLCRKSRGTSSAAFCLPIRRQVAVLRRAGCDPQTQM